jgi:hypothetical protein
MPIGTFRAAGTGLFPLCLGLPLMVLASMFHLALRVQASPSGSTRCRDPRSARVTQANAAVPGAIILATLLLNPFGYPLSVLLLLLALLRILGVKQWRVNLLISSVTTGVAYLVFVHWLKIPVPMGWLGL